MTFTAMWVTKLRENSIKPEFLKHFCDVALQETLGVPKAPLGAPNFIFDALPAVACIVAFAPPKTNEITTFLIFRPP